VQRMLVCVGMACKDLLVSKMMIFGVETAVGWLLIIAFTASDGNEVLVSN